MQNKIEKLNRLKKRRNAVILAHYYQAPEIQEIADHLGDSLALAQAAKNSSAEVILFCGVHFMAETAKIVNPTRRVLIPDPAAGCSLADSAEPVKFKRWIDAHPEHVIISYINCSARVKAMSDIICTSANAVRIVESIPEDRKICFAPDRYLGAHVMRATGRKMALWDGACQVHEFFSALAIEELKRDHPAALVLAHPECPENILAYADYVGSTDGIIKHAAQSEAREYIIATEPGIIHQMEKGLPGKKFYPVPNMDGCSCNVCPHMRLNSIDKMIKALETLSPEITLPESLRRQALKPLQRMLELSA